VKAVVRPALVEGQHLEIAGQFGEFTRLEQERARRLGVPAKIFVPRISSPAKIARIEQYAADLVVEGERYADALAASETWLADSGALDVHAFDQFETLLGQGTLGLELEQDAPGIESLLVSVGGGGLIGGVAAWYQNRLKVIGVEPSAAPTLHEALRAGRPVDAPTGGLAADSLAPKQVGQQMFPVAQRYVNEVALVDDEAIRDLEVALDAHAVVLQRETEVAGRAASVGIATTRPWATSSRSLTRCARPLGYPSPGSKSIVLRHCRWRFPGVPSRWARARRAPGQPGSR